MPTTSIYSSKRTGFDSCACTYHILKYRQTIQSSLLNIEPLIADV